MREVGDGEGPGAGAGDREYLGAAGDVVGEVAGGSGGGAHWVIGWRWRCRPYPLPRDHVPSPTTHVPAPGWVRKVGSNHWATYTSATGLTALSSVTLTPNTPGPWALNVYAYNSGYSLIASGTVNTTIPLLQYTLNNSGTNTGSLGSSYNLTINNAPFVSKTNPFGTTSYVMSLSSASTTGGSGGLTTTPFTVGTIYSISFWVNTGASYVAGSYTPMFYFNYSNTSTITGYGLELFNAAFLACTGSTTGFNYAAWTVTGGTGIYASVIRSDGSTGWAMSANTWYHIVFVCNTTTTIGQMYVNNNYLGAYAAYSIFGSTTSANFAIGNPSSVGSGSLTYYMYDLRLYNIGLTATQVNQLYTNQTVTY